MGRESDVAGSYDRVADEYVRRIYDELRHKPLDRELLDRFAGEVRARGLVCDLGCGPGHVARYLHERGVRVCGVDLSQAMVERARALSPAIEFAQGDMRALEVPAGSWAGIVAFYSIIHLTRAEVPRALVELHRVLRAGGLLLLGFHVGDDAVHLEEWWGHEVSLDFHFYRSDEVRRWLEAAGFEAIDLVERDPYAEVEAQTRRAYVFARKPGRLRAPRRADATGRAALRPGSRSRRLPP